ncbi:hypothetical protein B296_00035278, partial [Ensete ventricosum]
GTTTAQVFGQPMMVEPPWSAPESPVPYFQGAFGDCTVDAYGYIARTQIF